MPSSLTYLYVLTRNPARLVKDRPDNPIIDATIEPLYDSALLLLFADSLTRRLAPQHPLIAHALRDPP